MLRTQIYLPEDLRQEVDTMAMKEKKPAAKVFRELLEAGIDAKKQGQSIGDALYSLSKIKAEGPPDLSTNIDKYLYE